MQDKAIAAIGHWQLEQNKDLEPVDLYIENMFPGMDHQVLLLVFEIAKDDGKLKCAYNGIDIEKVSKESDSFRKYAYRKGSARGGDITFTTKLSFPPEKKLQNIKEQQFKKVTHDNSPEAQIFKLLKTAYIENEELILQEIVNSYRDFDKKEAQTTGFSIKIINEKELYLHDFESIRQLILNSGSEKKFEHNGTKSRHSNSVCSVTSMTENDIFGFAAPFKYSSPDKPGFISGFFNKKKYWRNYPVSSKESLALEYGKKFIQQNLSGYFYGHEFLFVPHPIIKTDNSKLTKIISLLQTSLETEKATKESKEKKRRAEDRVQKIIAQEDNYFYLDMLFFEENKTTKAISIKMMLEEILPSRFRILFIDIPEQVNKSDIFKEAIIIKKEKQDLRFSFQIIKGFFDKSFLDITQRIFQGKPIAKDFLFEHIMRCIRKNYNERKTNNNWTEPTLWSVKKAIMLMQYLQKLNIIKYNVNFNYMETESNEKKQGRFLAEEFNSFVEKNPGFFDSDIKVGIFSLGVLVRFLFDIQQGSLGSTPFENKLRGYKLNPEMLLTIYTEALDKIQKYQKNFYVYAELREIVNQKFVLNQHQTPSLNNNEISFYFVAGLELGKQFKREKEEN